MNAMNNAEQMKDVADRLKGLRDVMDVSVEEAAKVCGIPVDLYKQYEDGTLDVPLGVLFSMSREYKIDLATLINGEEPRQVSYFVTPKGKGTTVNRLSDYHFESLAFGYAHRKSDPFLVSINPGDIKEIHATTHPGQEFNYCLEGDMVVVIGESEVVLHEGDSIYFDSTKPHGQNCLNGKPCKFITIILN
mgnify:CR=1 FL=1